MAHFTYNVHIDDSGASVVSHSASTKEAAMRVAKAIVSGKTYKAVVYSATGWPERTQYSREPSGNLVGLLPYGSRPAEAPFMKPSTLNRNDGGDPFEQAVFEMQSGRFVVIEPDKDIPAWVAVEKVNSDGYGDIVAEWGDRP